MRWPRLTAASVLPCVLVSMVIGAGCDDGGEKKRNDLEAAAAAALGQGKDEKTLELEAKEAERRRKLLEDQKAKEAERAAKLEAIAAAVVAAPAKPSKNLEAACTELITIYEEWVKAVYFDDDGFQLDFFDHKRKNLGTIKGRCAKLASVEATDCMIEVIRRISAEDAFSEDDRKLVQGKPELLFDRCVEVYAPDKR
jgi:hypothetical protein